MFKHITSRLIFYFCLCLAVFSLLFLSMFTFLFKNYTIENHKADLEIRATAIATTFSSYMKDNETHKQGKNGYGAYVRFLNEFSMADIWILDNNRELFTQNGMHNNNHLITYNELPENANEIIDQVFQGKTIFGEQFSPILNSSTLTIGVPIYGDNETILGIVLMHTPIDAENEVFSKGLVILLTSIGAAAVVAVILSILLSRSFVTPLKEIEQTSKKLSQGNYKVQANVKQNDEIGSLSSSINELAIRLENSENERKKNSQLQKEFIASISHELRTPLTVIRGYLEALHDGIITDENQLKEYYRNSLAESLLLQRLVDDLLELTRLQTDSFSISNEKVNIVEVIMDAKNSAVQLANNKNITINTFFENSYKIILGDYIRLRQLILILVENAIKFSNPDSEINIYVNENTIVVEDFGVGISDENLTYIFQKFFTMKDDNSVQGTGLGLAIAKQIAEKHSFSLLVESKRDIGTKFIIKLL